MAGADTAKGGMRDALYLRTPPFWRECAGPSARAAAGKLEAHRELYDIGLHGPDVLFYYHAEKSTPVAALGNAMHDEPGRTFFDRARRVVHEEADREAALAYALGFVCHLRWTAPATPLWNSLPGRAV